MSATQAPSDRVIRTSFDLDTLRFEGTGELIPVVAQDADTGDVLMLAWANRAALKASLVTGELHFWSRSRGELWRKGQTSGNVLSVVSLHGDCDSDSVLALVLPAGPACHTGETTCFGEGASPSGRASVLTLLDMTLERRSRERPEGSYTVRLLDDANLRLKKLGEECAELVAALATGDLVRATEETADLLYHALVALRAEGIGADAVLRELEGRAG